MINRGVWTQFDPENLLFSLRLVRRGVSLTTHGGVGRGVYSPAVSLMEVLACLPVDISLSSMRPSRRLVSTKTHDFIPWTRDARIHA